MALGPVMAIALAMTAVSGTTAASDATLRISPATVAVTKDQTFAVQVVQDSPVATSGAQASVDFDPRILQVVSVAPGSAYASAPIFLPQDLAAVIATANQTGHLAQIAAVFTPPGAVATGTASFLVIRFQAVGCGETDLRLPTAGPLNAQMISGQSDAYGKPVSVVTTAGHVTTCVAPGAATASDMSPADFASGGLPVGLIAAVALIAIGSLGALLWRSRRRERPEDVA